jgi:hypothetical protein
MQHTEFESASSCSPFICMISCILKWGHDELTTTPMLLDHLEKIVPCFLTIICFFAEKRAMMIHFVKFVLPALDDLWKRNGENEIKRCLKSRTKKNNILTRREWDGIISSK